MHAAADWVVVLPSLAVALLPCFQTLWHKLRVPEEAREQVLGRWPGMGSEDLAGLHGELRRLEDKLAEARAKERVAQGNALRNAIMMVDTLEPKWMEMEAERVKLKALKAIPGSSKEAERMLMEEAKAVAKAEQRAIKKRKELFERFDAALQWLPDMKPELLDKFKVRPASAARLVLLMCWLNCYHQQPQPYVIAGELLIIRHPYGVHMNDGDLV